MHDVFVNMTSLLSKAEAKRLDLIVQLVRFNCEFWISCFCDDFTKDIKTIANTNIISKTHNQNQRATLCIQ